MAQSQCASCHAVTAGRESPNPRAPTFRKVADQHSRNVLEWELEAINDVGHYEMPPVALNRAQVESLAAYIQQQASDR